MLWPYFNISLYLPFQNPVHALANQSFSMLPFYFHVCYCFKFCYFGLVFSLYCSSLLTTTSCSQNINAKSSNRSFSWTCAVCTHHTFIPLYIMYRLSDLELYIVDGLNGSIPRNMASSSAHLIWTQRASEFRVYSQIYTFKFVPK